MAKAKHPDLKEGTRSSRSKEKTGLYIFTDILESLRYIEYKDDITRTDIVNEALSDYIIKWEKKNGGVPKTVK
jgi:hypothetical protein